MPKLLIASNNAGKLAEFRELLDGCGWEVVSPAEVGLVLDVAETGASYAANARIKAQAFAGASRLASLADDSGLEVDALNGEPGTLHHVKGWDGVNDAERITLLLDALKDVTGKRRTARYRVVIAVVLPDGRVIEEEGTCEGVIVNTPSGSGGFGYDPVFYLPSEKKTMAELTRAEKNQISHRAVAASKMRERLRALV